MVTTHFVDIYVVDDNSVDFVLNNSAKMSETENYNPAPSGNFIALVLSNGFVLLVQRI